MFDKRTLMGLGEWTGYRVAELEYRPGEGGDESGEVVDPVGASRKDDVLFLLQRADVRTSKLDPYKAQVDQLLAEGVWNATVILAEIRVRGYASGISRAMLETGVRRD